MLKKIVFVFLYFVSFSLYSQRLQKAFQIDWKPLVFARQDEPTQVPLLSFEGAVFNDPSGLLPFYSFEIDIDQDVYSIAINIDNERYRTQSLPDSGALSQVFNQIADTLNIQTRIKKTAQGKIAQISFIPIIRDQKKMFFRLLDSFNLNITLLKDQEKKAQKTFEFASESVMANGAWYKFSVEKSGIHKITGADLQKAGIALSGLNPSKISVFGFGGMLPEKNSNFRYADIPELAIDIVDGNDGKFDANDYLLFYAQGPDLWNYNSSKKVFEHTLNIYDRYAYYFVRIGAADGKHILQYNQPEDEADIRLDTYTDFAIIEDETYNLISSGRRWVGDKFEFTNSLAFPFDFENLVPNSEAYLKAVLVARSTATSSFLLKYNEQELGSTSIGKIPAGSYPTYAYDNTFEKYFDLSTDADLTIELTYNRPLSSAIGWLDYLELNVKRFLMFGSNQLAFRSSESLGQDKIIQFSIGNTSSKVLLWDISDFEQAKKILLSDGKFKTRTDVLHEFIAFTPEQAYNVEFVSEVANQNLHGISQVDMLIVCPDEFSAQAQALADFHQWDGLDVQVNTLDQIYNEFSSGSQDVTAIRDYVRAVYMHAPESKPLRYLLLFGDASFDYLNRTAINTNKVPTYESFESFDPINSIAIDDYFGFLDEDEGDLYYDDVDIGIGRLPVISAQEADEAVQKIKRYATLAPEIFGDWRNTLCFVADDEDNNLHIRQADELANMVDTIFPDGNIDKIYADAFPQVSTPAGQRYPKVNEAINERIDQGALIVSYTGHGGETGWGQERYLDMPDLEGWTNKYKLPAFLTATCEFARFDDPQRVSAGESIFLNPNGGGIALFTTSRATYAGSNFIMSKHFFDNALNHPDQHYLRMGDILKRTKRASGSGFNVMKFVLLGDPALKLSIPENKVQITQINESALNKENDTLKALSYVQIRGQINDVNGNKLELFNGFVFPMVFDKFSTITTLANDPGSQAFPFKLQENVLYKGKAEVKNGDFEFAFVVPKDIDYNYGTGKLSVYASSENQEATGFNRSLIIGGFDDTSPGDTKGPDIALYMNDENFVEGGMTDENPILIAKVSDENGINTIGNGIGHDITAFLDTNPTDLKILNNFYESDINTFKSGVIRYPFSNLESGEHELSFKVWDIYNNSSTAKLKFFVSTSAKLALEALMNYPNPFYEETVFSFEHNAGEQQLQVFIDIYAMDGRLVKHLEDNFKAYSSRINHMHWDGKDDNGSKISKGMYIYRIQLADEQGLKIVKTAKLVYLK
ncbi:MAG: type IX secretion system sortase PorU [Bacteroidales bacterium]|nr:type IX secretion system sortase PorU [Bacteroidales bacterium]